VGRGLREGDLDAADLPVELACHTGDQPTTESGTSGQFLPLATGSFLASRLIQSWWPTTCASTRSPRSSAIPTATYLLASYFQVKLKCAKSTQALKVTLDLYSDQIRPDKVAPLRQGPYP
jgi:hypothetical protein